MIQFDGVVASELAMQYDDMIIAAGIQIAQGSEFGTKVYGSRSCAHQSKSRTELLNKNEWGLQILGSQCVRCKMYRKTM
jgi:hypothetical protein